MTQVDGSLGTDRGQWVPPLGVRLVRYDPGTGESTPAECGSEVGGRWVTAYVRKSEYPAAGCGSLGRWLKSLWHIFVRPDSVRLIEVNRARGGVRRR
jgi:hypothetical protein